MSETIKQQFVLSKENANYLKSLKKEQGINYSHTGNRALDLYKELHERIYPYGIPRIEKYAKEKGIESGSFVGLIVEKVMPDFYAHLESEREKTDFVSIEAYEQHKANEAKKRREDELKRITSHTLSLEIAKQILGSSIASPSEENTVREQDASIKQLMEGDYEENNFVYLQLDNGEKRVFTFAVNKMI